MADLQMNEVGFTIGSRVATWSRTNPIFFDKDHVMDRDDAIYGLYNLVNNVPFDEATEDFLVCVAGAIEDGMFTGFTEDQIIAIEENHVDATLIEEASIDVEHDAACVAKRAALNASKSRL